MFFNKRTHTCGELRESDIGQPVVLNGWVDTRRDLGGLIFIDLRDRYGITQIVFEPSLSEEAHNLAKDLRSEYVISIEGSVRKRPPETDNAALPTGHIDVMVKKLVILNEAKTTPFPIRDKIDTSEDIRLKYRYLDLRRPSVQKNLLLRHKMYQIVRKYFDENNFVEIETPVLMKSTPEGARDYLVPSRIHKGKFYALPQSPQTYKQLLMISGFDRYFQIVKCFRDEDLRADRQPEFTQIDVEMSFVDSEDIYEIMEGLMKKLFKEVKGYELETPIPRLSFKEAIENGGIITGLLAPGCGDYTRNQLDVLTDFVKKLGAGGLIWMRVKEDGLEAPIAKFLTEEEKKSLVSLLNAESGDLLLLLSGNKLKTQNIMGHLRLEMAKRMNLIQPDSKPALLWVTDFPLFEWDEDTKRFYAMHHPFTSPRVEDIPLMDTDPAQVKARAYDLVLNGNEIAGGRIRLHDSALQAKMFNALGISDEEAQEKFGFLTGAFKYGAPPHGGIAFGFDRLAMLFAGRHSIRDVIAFPKTSSGISLMDESPSSVDENQLKELHIRVRQ